MKSFLEEYGFAILAAIVVILLIAMASPVGNLIKAQVLGVVESFGSSATGKLTSLESGDAISLSVKQATNENKFLYVAQSDSSSDTFKLQVRIKNSGGWSNFTDVTGKTAITGDGVQKELVVGTDVNCENGNQVEFQMVDNATGKIYSSASITFTAYEGGSSNPTEDEWAAVVDEPQYDPRIIVMEAFNSEGNEMDVSVISNNNEAEEAELPEITDVWYWAQDISSNIDRGIIRNVFYYYIIEDDVKLYVLPDEDYLDITFDIGMSIDENISYILLNEEELEEHKWGLNENGNLTIRTDLGCGSIIIVLEE